MENKEENDNNWGFLPLLLIFYLLGEDEFKNIEIIEDKWENRRKC